MKIKVGDYVETKHIKGEVVKIDNDYIFIKTNNETFRKFADKIGVKKQDIIKHEPFKCYEVLWYEGETEETALQGDFHTKEFATKKEAIKFYNQHENDEDKYMWLITKRNLNWEIVEDIIW